MARSSMNAQTLLMPMVQDPSGQANRPGETVGLVLGPAPAIQPEWANEPDVKTLKEDLQLADPSQADLVAKVHQWRQLREASTRDAPTVKNRSKVRPKLIRRQNEWRYAALSEPFLSSEKLFSVSPRTWEDVDAARKNELVLNWQMQTKLNRVKFIDEFVRAAVDDGTVIVRPSWVRDSVMEEEEEILWELYPTNDPQHLEALNQAAMMRQENPNGYEDLPEDLRQAVEYSMETGTPVMAVAVGSQVVEVERIIKNQPVLDILDVENVYIDPSCNGDIAKANFAIISFETSKAELSRDGRYTNLEYVNWSSANPIMDPRHSTTDTSGLGFKDELRKRIVAYEYWGFYDVEGTGKLVPIVATWVGDTMIRMEKNPYPDQKIPLILVQYMPVRNSVGGEPDAELLADNQQIIGALTRGMIDLLGRSANGQTGFAKGMLDVVNRRRYDQGEDYDFNPNIPPQNGIYHHTYPEIPNSALTMLELMNHEAEALTGVKAFSGGLSGNAYGDVATGIRGILDAASKREMGILRRLAQGIEEIGRKLIAMNALFLSEEETIQVTNEQFVQVSREDLAGEFDMEVDISTSEVDEARAADLGMMLQTLGNTIPFEITQKILVEIARLKRMPELSHELKQYKPQPDPLAEKAKELELAKMEYEIAKIEAQTEEIRANTTEALSKARLNNAKADMTDLDFVETETGTKHLRDMDKQGAQAAANEKLAITKGLIDAASKAELKRRETTNQ